MEKKDISVQELLDVLRGRAKEINEKADSVESAINIADKALTLLQPGTIQKLGSTVNLASKLKGFMGEKAFRAVVLAKVFNVPVEEVEKILTNTSLGFKAHKQGWFSIEKVKPQEVKTEVKGMALAEV